LASNATSLLTQGIIAQAVIAQNQPITKTGTVAAEGGTCIGFSKTSAAIGERFSVAVLGSGIGVAGGTIAANAALQVGANGTVITQSTGAIIGRAMNEAVLGDHVEVFIAPHGNVSFVENPLTGGIGALLTGNANVSKSLAIKTALEAAYRSNALIEPAIAPAPVWAASTTYMNGSTVRSIVAGSTSNLYMYVGRTTDTANGGVSAASGGPSGIGPALISDGTCVWMYVGAANASGTKLLYSTVTPTSSTDVMDGFLAYANTNNLAAMGMVATQLTAEAPLVNLTQCVLTNAITAKGKNAGTLAAPSYPSSTIKYCARFVTNAGKWIGFVAQNAIYQYSNTIKHIKVNGRFLGDVSALAYTGATVNPGMILLDLSSFPAGDKVIEVFGSDSFISPMSKIAVRADEFVYPLDLPNNFKIAIEGDSIGDMTATSALDYRNSRTDIALGELLGCQNVFNNCIGGTGMISTNGGTKTNWVDRLGDVVLFNPDLLIIYGDHNDVGSTQAAISSSFAAYSSAVRAALPYCTICVVGATLLATESVPNQLAHEQKLKVAFDVFNATDKNCFFVPVLSASPALLTSNNGYMFQNGGSPAPYTDGHPTPWFYYHMNRVIANGVRKFYRA
jgi:hypothetical protein